MNRTIEELVAAAPQMTPGQRLAQAKSFAFGNVNLSNPAVTREMVAAAARSLTHPVDVAAQEAVEQANVNLTLADLAALPGYVYLGSPYTKFDRGLKVAAELAAWYAGFLMRRGLRVFSPIAHGHAVEGQAFLPANDWAFWKRQCQPLIDAASSMVVLQISGWRESVGLTYEIECFVAAGKPIVYLNPEDL